jgi:hypothetical protein
LKDLDQIFWLDEPRVWMEVAWQEKTTDPSTVTAAMTKTNPAFR